MKTTIDDIHIYINIDFLRHIILLVLIVLVLIFLSALLLIIIQPMITTNYLEKLKKGLVLIQLEVDKNITLDTGYGKEKREQQ